MVKVPFICILLFCLSFFFLGIEFMNVELKSPCSALVEESTDQKINETSHAWRAGFQAAQDDGYSIKVVVVDDDGNTKEEHRWVKLHGVTKF